jgi:predicted helicase
LRAFAVKKSPIMTDKTKARVFHSDLHGRREEKYEFLNNLSVESIQWTELEGKEPNYSFSNSESYNSVGYEKGIKIGELFSQYSSGVETRKDFLVISFHESILKSIMHDFQTLNKVELQIKYKVDDKSRDWKIDWAINDIKTNKPSIEDIAYKPFDKRKIIYTGKTKGINGYPMYENFKHIIRKENIGIIAKRGRLLGSNNVFCHISLANQITDKNFLADLSYCFPLYLYPDPTNQSSINQYTNRTPNLNQTIVNQIAGQLGLTFTNEKEEREGTFAPIDMLDYIYAVLHSPTYRAKYKEFLKIDFPRVPYPKDRETFWKLVKLGGELRQIHLLESPVTEKFITTYPNDGANQVVKITYEEGKVRINEQQYFDNVPPVAWSFYIGGYQPAQKWLKDRKGRTLSFDDIMHYQKIIVALTETDRIMQEIDGIEIE